jgi:hypothetical protein
MDVKDSAVSVEEVMDDEEEGGGRGTFSSVSRSSMEASFSFVSAVIAASSCCFKSRIIAFCFLTCCCK